jgi:hypothetical protein
VCYSVIRRSESFCPIDLDVEVAANNVATAYRYWQLWVNRSEPE